MSIFDIFRRKPPSAKQNSKNVDERRAECPYCKAQLTRAPKKRTACVSCRRPIFVRKGRLCTEDEARALDFCARLGVSVTRLDKTRDTLSKEFGHPASAADSAWRVMNTLVSETKDYHARGMIYFQMARFLWEAGKDHLQVARKVPRMQLAAWRKSADAGLLDLRGIRLTVITAREASCPNCRKLEGTELTYQQAMHSSPIPVPECTNGTSLAQPRGWCRCTFGLRERQQME